MDEAKIRNIENRISALENKKTIDRYLDNQSKDILGQIISDRILDIVWNDYFYYQTYFESLDGWNLIDSSDSGTDSLVSRLGVHLVTGTSTNDESSIDKEPVYQNVLSFDQPSKFASAFFVTTVSDTEAFIGVGEVNNGATGHHYGFRIDDNILKGSVADGTTQSTVNLLTITTNSPTTFDPVYYVEAHFFPGYKVDFYVRKDDEDLKFRGSITTNIPTGDMFEWLGARMKTTTTASAALYFTFMEYIQKRNPR